MSLNNHSRTSKVEKEKLMRKNQTNLVVKHVKGKKEEKLKVVI